MGTNNITAITWTRTTPEGDEVTLTPVEAGSWNDGTRRAYSLSLYPMRGAWDWSIEELDAEWVEVESGTEATKEAARLAAIAALGELLAEDTGDGTRHVEEL